MIFSANRVMVIRMHLVRLDDGSQRMYYTGQGADGSTAIGIAKFDDSVGRWAREQAEFTFAS